MPFLRTPRLVLPKDCHLEYSLGNATRMAARFKKHGCSETSSLRSTRYFGQYCSNPAPSEIPSLLLRFTHPEGLLWRWQDSLTENLHRATTQTKLQVGCCTSTNPAVNNFMDRALAGSKKPNKRLLIRMWSPHVELRAVETLSSSLVQPGEVSSTTSKVKQRVDVQTNKHMSKLGYRGENSMDAAVCQLLEFSIPKMKSPTR